MNDKGRVMVICAGEQALCLRPIPRWISLVNIQTNLS